MSRIGKQLSNKVITEPVEEKDEEIELGNYHKQKSRINNSSTGIQTSQTSQNQNPFYNETIINIVLKNNTNENILLKKITIQDNKLVKEVIKEAIIEFNKIFENERMMIRLSDNIDLYKLKPSKKSGLPNYDLPSKLILN
jgi:hypothetical protein